MAFVAYLVGLAATFVGVFILYGTLMKPFTAKLQEPIDAAVEHQSEPTATRPARKPDTAEEARAEADSRDDGSRVSRRSPVRSEPDGLRLRPERCWIVTDATRNYGYYGECR